MRQYGSFLIGDGLGGAGVHWNGQTYGKNKIPAEMTIQDWGITYEDDKWEKMAGIAGEDNPLGGKRSSPFPTYGAKGDPVVTVIPVAKKTGKFEIRTHSHVRRILHTGNKATGVLYTDITTGEEIEQPADIVVLTGFVFSNARILLMSQLGKPYDPQSGTGSIGKNYAYQVRRGNAVGFFENKKFNNFAGAGGLVMIVDDYNGDNFDHSHLNFIHGGMIILGQTGYRPILNNLSCKYLFTNMGC
jgi:gluconate 2-dehydrogenase alpha chain